VPKCLGAEVSWYRSVLGPKCPVTLIPTGKRTTLVVNSLQKCSRGRLLHGRNHFADIQFPDRFLADNTVLLTAVATNTGGRTCSPRAKDRARLPVSIARVLQIRANRGAYTYARIPISAYRHRASRSAQMSSAISITGKFIRRTVKNLPTGQLT